MAFWPEDGWPKAHQPYFRRLGRPYEDKEPQEGVEPPNISLATRAVDRFGTEANNRDEGRGMRDEIEPDSSFILPPSSLHRFADLVSDEPLHTDILLHAGAKLLHQIAHLALRV